MLFRLLFISVTVCVVRWCVPCLNREMNAIDRESGYSNYRQCSAVCLQLCSCSFETWLSWSCFNSFLLCLWIWTQNSAEHFKNSIFWWLHINQRNCVCLSYCLRCSEELKKLLRLLWLRCFSSQSWRTSDRPELSQLRVLHVQIVLSCCFFVDCATWCNVMWWSRTT